MTVKGNGVEEDGDDHCKCRVFLDGFVMILASVIWSSEEMVMAMAKITSFFFFFFR